jgi:hypothetical protein
MHLSMTGSVMRMHEPRQASPTSPAKSSTGSVVFCPSPSSELPQTHLGEFDMKRILIPALLTLCGTPDANGATFRVGNAVACDFATAQAAINAAAASPGADLILLSNDLTYAAQALTIGAQDLIIEGGYTDCSSGTSTSSTTLSGEGGSNAPVLTITGGGQRELRRLGIIRGDQSASSDGGGIHFDGSGELILLKTTIFDNFAGYGGGINFKGSGGLATLTLLDENLVLSNTAQVSGGGIRIEGTARLLLLGDQTSVQSNQALGINPSGGGALGGYGGGIQILSPARADVGASGFGGNGAVYDNEAVRGGGIAVVASGGVGDVDSATLRMFTTDPTKPTRVNNNRASLTGGAIYLLPHRIDVFAGTNTLPANACLYDTRIDGNRAENGSALYADTDLDPLGVGPSTFVAFNRGYGVCEPEPASALGAVSCAGETAAGCNQLADNVAVTSSGVATDGAAILMQSEGYLWVRGLALRNNSGGNVIRTIDLRDLELRNSLIANNAVTQDALRLHTISAADVSVLDNTFVDNSLSGATHVIRIDDAPNLANFAFQNNLIWQPGKLSVLYPGGFNNLPIGIAEYNLSNDISTLPSLLNYATTAARFIDPALGDYRLRVGAAAVDFSPAVPGDDHGLDDRPRDQDVVIVPGYHGVRDAGAYERSEADPWVLNGHFDGNLNLWSNATPTLTSFSALNATGSTGGSVAFSHTPTVGTTTSRYAALAQCFNVPAPGIYQLTAHGRAPGSVFTTHDTPVIRWRVRTNSDLCGQADPIAQEGDLFLPNGSTFAAPLEATSITILPSAFTANTTIELRLDVIPDVVDAPISVGFDAVSLTGTGFGAALFANGFE